MSGLSRNLKPAAPIFDTLPSVQAFQAVNKGLEGSALSGRPNLRPSPVILPCTPRHTLTHPLGLTYTLRGPPWEHIMLSERLRPSVLCLNPPPSMHITPASHHPSLHLPTSIHSSVHPHYQSQHAITLKTFVIHPSAPSLSLLHV